MVPVSVRAEDQRGTLGNRVAACTRRSRSASPTRSSASGAVHEALGDLKGSAQAIGAETLTQMAGFAAPTLLDQGARLQAHQRLFNVTVTNVPGPQFPLFMLGRSCAPSIRRSRSCCNTALGIAIMSYDGMIFFGLLGDYEAMADIDDLVGRPAGVDRRAVRRRGRARSRHQAQRPRAPRRGGRRRARARLEAGRAGDRDRRGGAARARAACSAPATTPRSAPAEDGPGELRPDRGAAHDGPASAAGEEPPTSGTHRPVLVTRDRRTLSDDQIIHALELGNVVILYERPGPRHVAQARAAGGGGAVRRGGRRRGTGRDPRPADRPGRPRPSRGAAS